ncbi:MAG: hypothetical protein DWQ07_17110 [Chloroflexi bacterium]|nr:MAG: hypothetical protein DWQ07_17110 [Chloroflexota bacterium]MBL1195125.1 hypothetical protein [Chloroflexota bacterium]NOH12411.1 hypothetical protein [Chloroflexota bacterium]
MTFAECPSCQGEIKLGNRPHMGQQIRCRNCDAQLEVVWLNPIELDWVETDDYQDDYDPGFEEENEYIDELEEYEEETDG